MSDSNPLNELKNTNLPVIICGAGIVGKILLELCRNNNIQVECFCDSSQRTAGSSFCDLEVIYTPDLNKRYSDATLIISVAAIKDVVDLLAEQGFTKWYAGGNLLKEIDTSQNNEDSSLNYDKFAVENCIICHDGYLNPNKLFFRSIDLIITERCSLKCKDCSNLMQYYENPQNCNTGMLLKSIDVFCTIVDDVMDFRVIGGEVFMNPEWHVIVDRLITEPKAQRVVLYTNGTIIPKDEYLNKLQNDKVIVIATNYGPLSKNIDKLKNIMTQKNISHHVLTMDDWLDCSKISPHNRGQSGNIDIFKQCCAKNMPTLSEGKLFRCPYAANAFRLKAAPDIESDYIDIFSEPIDQENVIKTKQKIKDYILHKDFLEICDFCSGRPLSGPEVTPAVQAKNPLQYHKYSIN